MVAAQDVPRRPVVPAERHDAAPAGPARTAGRHRAADRRFLAEANRAYQRRWTGLDGETLGLLRHYSWPGNVRELRAVISRAALMNDEQTLRPIHLPAEIISAALATPESPEGRAAGQDDAARRHSQPGGARGRPRAPRAGAVLGEQDAGGAVPGDHTTHPGKEARRRRVTAVARPRSGIGRGRGRRGRFTAGRDSDRGGRQAGNGSC